MPGRKSLVLFAVCVAIAATARPAAAEVQITINAGRVSVSARNATVGQILAEWARVGQTTIVNAERISGGPMTLELSNVPEIEAIEILLRAAGGYLLAPRHLATANTSVYDRILILPPSSPVANVSRGVAAPLAPPSPVQQPRPFVVPQPGSAPPPSDDNDDPPERPNVAMPAIQNGRQPVFNTFPQAPQRTEPPAATAPTSGVTAPVGVAVPGMVAPTPGANQPGVITPAQPR